MTAAAVLLVFFSFMLAHALRRARGYRGIFRV